MYASVAKVSSSGALAHLLYSSDDGATWKSLPLPDNLPLTLDSEFDIALLGAGKIIIAYLDINGNLLTARSNNNGASWSKTSVAWGRPCDPLSSICPVYTLPRLARLSSGRVYLVYGKQYTITAEGAPAGYPRGFITLYSDNEGASWAGNWDSREVGKFPHDHPNLGGKFQVSVPMHNVIDGASRFILGYIQHEFILPESMGYTLAFKQSGMMEGSYVVIQEAEGQEEKVIYTRGGTSGELWKFAASPNGQYMAFITNGCVVTKSNHEKHSCTNAVAQGSLLVYSVDAGKKWYYVVLPETVKGAIGSLGYDSYAGLQVTDSGNLFMTFPSSSEPSSELKFLAGQLCVPSPASNTTSNTN